MNSTINNSKFLNTNFNIFLEPSEPFQFQSNSLIEPFYKRFFSSFPYKKAKVIENSLGFPTIWSHEIFSKFPAMQPAIIFKYPIQGLELII